MPPLDSHARGSRMAPLAIAIALLAGCQMANERSDEAKQDTSTRPASVGTSAAGEAARAADSLGDSAGVPAVPNPADTGAAASDTGIVRMAPARATRGGVVFALAQGIATPDPRCSWAGAPIPCRRHEAGVLAIVPIDLEAPARAQTLVFERPGGRIVREIPVVDRELPRELVFVSDSLYRLLGRRTDIARDARIVRRVISAPGTDDAREWGSGWRSPVAGTPRGFGAERFFYPASDSGRSIRLDPELRAAGVFGIDTARAGRNAAPGWRWGGVDYDVRAGTAVAAPAPAVVAEVGDYTLTGRTLVLDHGRGAFSAYYHLDTVLVRKGEELPAGRTVGRVGSTGLTSRPRLHYAVFVHGRPVDPQALREIPPFAR